MEAEIVVRRGRADTSLAEKVQRFAADRLPVLRERREIGKARDIHVRSIGHGREQVHQRVVRRHQRRMIGELPEEAVTHAAAIMHVHRRGDEQVQDDEFRRKQRGEHGAVKPVTIGARAAGLAVPRRTPNRYFNRSVAAGAFPADRRDFRHARFHRRCTHHHCSGWRTTRRSRAALYARVVRTIASLTLGMSTAATGASNLSTCLPSSWRQHAAGSTGAPVASANTARLLNVPAGSPKKSMSMPSAPPAYWSNGKTTMSPRSSSDTMRSSEPRLPMTPKPDALNRRVTSASSQCGLIGRRTK